MNIPYWTGLERNGRSHACVFGVNEVIAVLAVINARNDVGQVRSPG